MPYPRPETPARSRSSSTRRSRPASPARLVTATRRGTRDRGRPIRSTAQRLGRVAPSTDRRRGPTGLARAGTDVRPESGILASCAASPVCRDGAAPHGGDPEPRLTRLVARVGPCHESDLSLSAIDSAARSLSFHCTASRRRMPSPRVLRTRPTTWWRLCRALVDAGAGVAAARAAATRVLERRRAGPAVSDARSCAGAPSLLPESSRRLRWARWRALPSSGGTTVAGRWQRTSVSPDGGRFPGGRQGCFGTGGAPPPR